MSYKTFYKTLECRRVGQVATVGYNVFDILAPFVMFARLL